VAKERQGVAEWKHAFAWIYRDRSPGCRAGNRVLDGRDRLCADSPGDETWIILEAKDGSGKRISLALSETPVQVHRRIHLDLHADDQAAEIERLKALGAVDVDWDLYPAHPDFAVVADTEGNRFCVIDKSA
jgi:hypothetical protein